MTVRGLWVRGQWMTWIDMPWGVAQGSYTMPDQLERPDPLKEPEGYGASRARQDAGPAAGGRLQEAVHDDQCDVHLVSPLGKVRCLNAPNWTIWYGCPAEHVAASDVCDGHLRSSLGDPISCEACGNRSVVRPSVIKRWHPPAEWKMEVPAAELPVIPGPDLRQFFSGPAGPGRFA